MKNFLLWIKQYLILCREIYFPVLTNPSIYKVPLLRDFCFTAFVMHRYFIIYKPYLVLSQFSPEGDQRTLRDILSVPKDVYPVGRLDHDSEGLLILSNDAALNQKLLHPKQHQEKEYWIQVDGAITDDAIIQLQKGVQIQVNGKQHRTLPATVKKFTTDPALPDRHPPIRFRKSIPAPWISITIREGKNRQVRRMTAAVGFPTLRLVRYRIGSLTIEGMQPGDCIEMEQKALYHSLFGQS